VLTNTISDGGVFFFFFSNAILLRRYLYEKSLSNPLKDRGALPRSVRDI
jgi:hypothetical protein